MHVNIYPNHWHTKPSVFCRTRVADHRSSGLWPVSKILMTLEPYGSFGSNFLKYLFILKMSSHWYTQCRRGFAQHHSGRSRYFSKNAHNPWTAWYILIKICIVIHFNIYLRIGWPYIVWTYFRDKWVCFSWIQLILIIRRYIILSAGWKRNFSKPTWVHKTGRFVRTL